MRRVREPIQKWLKIVKLNVVIAMHFRNGKMPRSHVGYHVDTAYAAISTVKVAANTTINRIRVKVNEKQNFEIGNSVSQGIFREFRPFPAITENHWP